MSLPLEAKGTFYNGYVFRSRLEAKWSFVFSSLGLNYKYEPELFETPIGKYLPDFYMPDLNIFVEIKPFAANNIEGAKIDFVSKKTGRPAILIAGIADRLEDDTNPPGFGYQNNCHFEFFLPHTSKSFVLSLNEIYHMCDTTFQGILDNIFAKSHKQNFNLKSFKDHFHEIVLQDGDARYAHHEKRNNQENKALSPARLNAGNKISTTILEFLAMLLNSKAIPGKS